MEVPTSRRTGWPTSRRTGWIPTSSKDGMDSHVIIRRDGSTSRRTGWIARQGDDNTASGPLLYLPILSHLSLVKLLINLTSSLSSLLPHPHPFPSLPIYTHQKPPNHPASFTLRSFSIDHNLSASSCHFILFSSSAEKTGRKRQGQLPSVVWHNGECSSS
jgi:hypothetical protein